MSERRARYAVAVGYMMAVLAFAGCSEDSTPENALTARLPYTEYVVRDTVIGASASGTFKDVLGMNGTINLLGTWNNYSASMLVAFSPAYFPFRDTARVFDAKLTLTSVSRLGNSSGTLGFTVYRILQTWNEMTATSDTVVAGFYESSIARGSYSGSGGADTQKVELHLDTAMVREWLSTSLTANKNGFILVPTPGSSIIRGFGAYGTDSSGYYPTLTIIAGNAAGTALDTSIYNICIDTFSGNITNFVPEPSLMYAQSGIMYRSRLNFDIGFLPKGAAVNRADLRLRAKQSASILTPFSDSLFVVHNLQSPTDSTLFTLANVTFAHTADSLSVYAGDIRNAVQAWVRGPNNGLLLRMNSTHEFNSFDMLALYNQAAPDPKLRPSLHIVYTVPKQ